jgi:hypothetical protein
MSCHETKKKGKKQKQTKFKNILAVFNVVFCCFVVLFDLVQGCLTLHF